MEETIDPELLAHALVMLGCPAEKSAEMAAQLDKRARQIAEQKGQSYKEALAYLLSLMRQGWAAPGEGKNSNPSSSNIV